MRRSIARLVNTAHDTMDRFSVRFVPRESGSRSQLRGVNSAILVKKRPDLELTAGREGHQFRLHCQAIGAI